MLGSTIKELLETKMAQCSEVYQTVWIWKQNLASQKN